LLQSELKSIYYMYFEYKFKQQSGVF